MAEWTDELRAQVVADYLAEDPTGDTTVEIIEGIAEDIGKTVNGVRLILSRAGAHVKATPVRKAASGTKSSTTRVSKQDSIDALSATLESLGVSIDGSIVNKLTGKAAIYFNDAFQQVSD